MLQRYVLVTQLTCDLRDLYIGCRERDDLLELCSALQTTLARFHGQQLEGQARIKRAQHAVETSTFAKEQVQYMHLFPNMLSDL